MNDNVLKRLASVILPGAAYDTIKRLFLSREARRLRERCTRQSNIDAVVAEVLGSNRFRPSQKPGEIRGLLELLQPRHPRHLCEIGGYKGGSLALLAQIAQSNARILSIDVDYRPGQKEALAAFAKAGQAITCMAADSHVPETRDALVRWLDGAELDFLFIDGDHSFAGATCDFQMYAPFVKRGGIIAFHDIVPDKRTRTGIASVANVGDVPAVWREIKRTHSRTAEFVDDWNQDGFGIGVVYR